MHKIGLYKLDIDFERTHRFYDTQDNTLGCDCLGCKNYEKAISVLSPSVRQFLSQFGLQPEKPAEMSAVYTQDKQLLYDGFFHICGQILDEQDPWVPTGPKSYQLNPGHLLKVSDNCSAYLTSKCGLLDSDFPLPAIQLHISFTLPWLLDEPNPYTFTQA